MQDTNDTVEAIRRFNRFYTRRIGIVTDHYLNSPYSLTEARVFYELNHQPGLTAKRLRSELALDAGYLSRILKRFEEQGLIKRERTVDDARQTVLRLTRKGAKVFDGLADHSKFGIRELLSPLCLDDRRKIINAMEMIEQLLTPGTEPVSPYLIRLHQPGDMGWVIRQHGKLYHEEYNWDIAFEGFVADIAGQFIRNFDPQSERCWMAEKDGETIGSAFLVRHSKTIAKLRMLIVTPKARGLGVGTRLVEECIRFAGQAKYKKIRLWTVSILTAARKIYEKAGFQLIREEANHSFGQDLIDETWELTL